MKRLIKVKIKRLMSPALSRIFVEESYILKNAAKLANIPVHIVQVNEFTIKDHLKDSLPRAPCSANKM